MENDNTITLEAVGKFPFQFYIEKAVARDDDEEMIIEGIASTTNIDHDKERMSKEAIASMEAAINRNGVPLRVEHQGAKEAIIGHVFEAHVDDRNQLHIRARLDKDHPTSPILHAAIKNGTKMGLSVGGVVKRAVREFAESVGGYIKTFYDVALQEVSVTPRPSNFDSWLVRKSIAKDENDARRFADSPLRSTFLFENPHLDYLQTFNKSIPDKAWHKVATSTMAYKDRERDESDETETRTNKAPTRAEFNSLKSMVADGFTSIMNVMKKAMSDEALDQRQPDEGKSEEEWDRWSARKAEGSAMDQENPDEEKPRPIGEKARKTSSETDEDERDEKREEKRRKTSSETETEGSDLRGEREEKRRKASSESDEDEREEKRRKTSSESDEDERDEKREEKRRKTSSETEEDEDRRKASDTETETEREMRRTIKALRKMSETDEEREEKRRKTSSESDEDERDEKREEKRRKTSSETDEDEREEKRHKTSSEEDEEEDRRKTSEEEDEHETRKSHPLDELVLQIGKSMIMLNDRLEKSTGYKQYGFEKAAVNALREDPAFQEELQKMMKVPGHKKSMSMGHVFVPSKTGERLQLTPVNSSKETVKKSTNKNFRDFYKSEYSSFQEE